MKLSEQIRWAGGLRRFIREQLWVRGVVRCNYCVGQSREEWDAMCDCFVPHKWWVR